MAPRVSQVAIRRQYNDLDRWRVYNAFLSNGGNTKKTARDTFIALSTVRSWIRLWDFPRDSKGEIESLDARNPPQQPTQDELEEIKDDGDVVQEYEDLRSMALTRLREVIPKTNSADQLGRVVKDMSERIDRAKGITGGEVPSTVNVNLRLAEAREAGSELMSLIGNTLAAAHERSRVIDADPEPLALPPASQSEMEEVQTDA